jgi:molybdopterin converting factor small subunit
VKIEIESIGLPTLSKLIGKKTNVELYKEAATVRDLVSLLVKSHGKKMNQILLDSEGELDLTIQVMINDEGFLARKDYARRELGEGDTVKFMLLVGGG